MGLIKLCLANSKGLALAFKKGKIAVQAQTAKNNTMQSGKGAWVLQNKGTDSF